MIDIELAAAQTLRTVRLLSSHQLRHDPDRKFARSASSYNPHPKLVARCPVPLDVALMDKIEQERDFNRRRIAAGSCEVPCLSHRSNHKWEIDKDKNDLTSQICPHCGATRQWNRDVVAGPLSGKAAA